MKPPGNGRPHRPDPLVNTLGPLDGKQIPGGCDDCDAYQTVRPDGPLVWRVTIHHDEGCPTLARVRAAQQ